MGTQERTGAAAGANGTVGRRGLVAAAAAMVVGLAARHVADATPVAASNTDTNFIATGTSTNFDAKGTATFGVDTYFGTFTTGVYGRGNSTGVVGYGSGSGSTGVYAEGSTYGVNATGGTTGVTATGGTGVYASGTGSNSTGVYATGSTYGVNATASSSGGVGVQSAASGPGNYGVLGTTSGAGSVACSGQATGPGSYGVYGTSTTSHGVYGITAAPGASSVYGYAVASGAAAINGTAGSAAYAGSFTGAVVVNGQFVAYGGGKSAALPHPDGSHRLVYCVESPESWLEDFGEAKLVGGRAEIKIDPDFAAVADTGKMHVFLSETGEETHLRVSRKDASGFTAEASATLAAMRGRRMEDVNGTFSYRMVAKRKDIEGKRLAKFTLPKVDTAAPKVPEPPKATEPPKPPERADKR